MIRQDPINSRFDSLMPVVRHVADFGLTFVLQCTKAILSTKDEPIFLRMMQDKVCLSSADDKIVDHL